MHTRRVALPLVALALACSEPPRGDTSCISGTEWNGLTCTTPELTGGAVDGDGSDWATAAWGAEGCLADVCEAGDVERFQVALETGGEALVVWATTAGPPVTDGTLRYYVLVRDGDIHARQIFGIWFLAGFGAIYGRGWDEGLYAVSGVPVDVAYGSAGMEWRIPLDLLPFAGDVRVEVGQFVPDHPAAPTSFTPRNPGPWAYAVCWDRDAAQNSCAVSF